MKTILIPTDFSLQSLNIIKNATSYFAGEKLNVVLFHALHTPTDIQDLLFINPLAPQEKITEEFRHACAALKKRHSPIITGITFKSMYGNTAAVFRNFIEANGIDCIYMPEHVMLRSVYQDSVELRSLFKNATIPFITNTIASKQTAAPAFTKALMLAED